VLGILEDAGVPLFEDAGDEDEDQPRRWRVLDPHNNRRGMLKIENRLVVKESVR
jgi:hypothetical protein